ncbi:HDOD domain-containing protein [Campylobacterota bacterium]|nr:HDOD domain-containing protein [Campylobacterota bacterium]
MNEALYSHIKSLPPLPESATKIQAICADPHSGVADLAKVIETDPMLTANLLKAANSPLYGFSREIKTLAQAVSLFGMATVRGFALAGAVKSTLKIDMSPYGMDAERFVDLAQLQNALMIRWYGQVNRAMLDILSPAAFLTNVGRVILAREIVGQGKTAEFANFGKEHGYEAAEEKYLDATYQEVSAAVFTQWRFEQEIVDSIAYSLEPEHATEPNMRRCAQALKVVQATVTTPAGITAESIESAGELVTTYGMNAESFSKAASALIK